MCVEPTWEMTLRKQHYQILATRLEQVPHPRLGAMVSALAQTLAHGQSLDPLDDGAYSFDEEGLLLGVAALERRCAGDSLVNY